jgi:hypothetical protein
MTEFEMKFGEMMKTVMKGRPNRHFLWVKKNDPHPQLVLEDYSEIANWAINGSPTCRKYLFMRDKSDTEILQELTKCMDKMDRDQNGYCIKCLSTDICGCICGHCPYCDSTLCEEYKCRMNIPGARGLYLKSLVLD